MTISEYMKREIGPLLIAAGVLLVLISSTDIARPGGGIGGVILIGPIPVVFGSSPEMAIASMILALVLMAVSYLLFRGRG
jgi:uncharacterized protein (TIGR00304 family)